MRLQACIPQSYWEFALDYATHIYNHTPIRRLQWKSPWEVMTRKPNKLDYLRVFGSAAYVFLSPEIRKDKMSPKSELMTFLGMVPGHKGWLFMCRPRNILFTAAHAIFDEALYPSCPKSVRPDVSHINASIPEQRDCSKQHCAGSPESCPCTFDDEEHPPQKARQKQNSRDRREDPEPQVPDAMDSDEPVTDSEEEEAPAPPPSPPPAPGPRHSQREKKIAKKPGNVYGDKSPVKIEKSTRRIRDWKRIVKEQAPLPAHSAPGPSKPIPEPPSDSGSDSEVRASLEPDSPESEESNLAKLCQEGGAALTSFLITKAEQSHAEHKLDRALVFGSKHTSYSKMQRKPVSSNPKEWTYKDILKLPPSTQPEWQAACEREIETLQNREVFKLVKRPQDRKVIKNRWVFDVKDDGQKRAHLVAKGFSQVEGLDFDQIFSPVVRFETVCLILAMAALNDWVMYGLDVHNAYLYGEPDEEIYMEQPEGFRVQGQENDVLRLCRALYGLKQAGLAWWQALKESMEKLGFKSLNSDAGVFILKINGSFVIAIIYVDDAIFCGPIKAFVIKYKEAFKKRWETRDLGELTQFLRMKITCDGRKIHLDQCAYLRVVLERCGMSNAKSAVTPLPAGYVPTKPAPEYAAPRDLRSRYQTVIGSLLCLMLGTRPDIAYAVTKLAQYAANPLQEHLDKALYICRYLVGTQHYCLAYNGSSGKGLHAITDSDWASDKSDRRSQSGYFVSLAGGLISWTSRAQKTIALLSTEAEYMVLSDCSCQVVWMHTLLGELGYHFGPIPICGDNQGSIFIASNPVTEKHSKHIDIWYHYIREVIARKLATVYFIDGDKNPTDLLTKNLGSVKFLKFRSELGLEILTPNTLPRE